MNITTHKKLAVIDLDGTIIKGQSQKYLINYFFEKKLISASYYLKIMVWFFLYKLGLTKDVKGALEFALVFLKDKTPEEIGKLIDSFYDEVGKYLLYSQTKEFILKLKSDGYEILLISSAVDAIAVEFSDHLGIKNTIATKLEIKDGKYTAHIEGEIIYDEIKKTELEKYCKKNNFSLMDCSAYGDHYTDLPLLQSVNHGYFVNPDRRTKHLADENNIDIMYLQ